MANIYQFLRHREGGLSFSRRLFRCRHRFISMDSRSDSTSSAICGRLVMIVELGFNSAVLEDDIATLAVALPSSTEEALAQSGKSFPVNCVVSFSLK